MRDPDRSLPLRSRPYWVQVYAWTVLFLALLVCGIGVWLTVALIR